MKVYRKRYKDRRERERERKKHSRHSQTIKSINLIPERSHNRQTINPSIDRIKSIRKALLPIALIELNDEEMDGNE